MQGFHRTAEPRPEDSGGSGRVESDVPRAAGRAGCAPDLVRVAALRAGEQAGELVAADGFGAGDVEDAGEIGRRELEQRGRDLLDARRSPDLVGVELDVVPERERLLRAGLAVEQRRTDDQRIRMELADELLGGELRLAVARDGARLVVLDIAAVALAVEDEVGRDVNQPRAGTTGGARDVPRAFDDRALDLGVGLAVGRVDHDVWRL